jgi:hypothetical protein
MDGPIKISLLENALDYILDAVQQLQSSRPSKKRIKYGIVHLWSGIELLLKKRLMDEHWSLIFRDTNKADRKALESGEFVSVNFDDALVRLKNICNVDLANYKEALNKIREDRNRLEHFQIVLSKLEVVSNLAKAWSFILDFTVSHINLNNDPQAMELFDKIREKMILHEKFITERMQSIEPELQKVKSEQYPYTIVDCPACFQDTLLLKGGVCECLFCKTVFDWETAMEKWLILREGYNRYYDKDRLIDPLITECPECEFEALYRFEDGDAQPPDPAAICFHCGSSFSFCRWCHYKDSDPDDENSYCKECSLYNNKKGLMMLA